MNINPAQEKFCQAIVEGKNQSDAYKKAYPKSRKWIPKSVNEKASKLAASAKVKARIQELKARVAELSCLNAADIQEEIRRLAHSDIAQIMKPGSVVKMPDELDPATRSAVASFKIDEYGRIEYKFWDKNSALEKAARIKGLFKEDNAQQNSVAKWLATMDITGLQPVKR